MGSHLPSTIDNKCSEPQASSTEPDRDAKFLAMLPRIRRQAAYYLRHLSTEERADAIQEVVASAFVSYVRLIERGKADAGLRRPAGALCSLPISQWSPSWQSPEWYRRHLGLLPPEERCIG